MEIINKIKAIVNLTNRLSYRAMRELFPIVAHGFPSSSTCGFWRSIKMFNIVELETCQWWPVLVMDLI